MLIRYIFLFIIFPINIVFADPIKFSIIESGKDIIINYTKGFTNINYQEIEKLIYQNNLNEKQMQILKTNELKFWGKWIIKKIYKMNDKSISFHVENISKFFEYIDKNFQSFSKEEQNISSIILMMLINVVIDDNILNAMSKEKNIAILIKDIYTLSMNNELLNILNSDIKTSAAGISIAYIGLILSYDHILNAKINDCNNIIFNYQKFFYKYSLNMKQYYHKIKLPDLDQNSINFIEKNLENIILKIDKYYKDVCLT